MPRLHWPRSQSCLGTRNNLRASAHSADTPGAFARARGRDGAGTGQPVPVSSATTASRSAADAVRAVASCASNASTYAISSSTFATIRRCSARGGMGSIKSRMLFPLVPKFHLGTHLAAKLRFAMALNGGRRGEPAERQSKALHTSPFPSKTWERGGKSARICAICGRPGGLCAGAGPGRAGGASARAREFHHHRSGSRPSCPPLTGQRTPFASLGGLLIE